MGANQSSASGGSGHARKQTTNQVRVCYYELLAISRTATDEEIKKAYRKKALELHPDRNYGNVEATTQLFAEVQSAYEVLSDPQERAWYDSHRNAILFGDDEDGSNYPYEHNVRMTTSHDILQTIGRFHGQADFTDSPNGFYATLRGIFTNLAKEEELACGWEGVEPFSYPSFGSANDDYQDTVRSFYAVWTAFATRKPFAWKELYKYSDAPDRRVRRLMEKENKRLREESIREFNDAVRSLVVLVRKRDPRVKSGKETEADRQRTLRDAASAQAARSRAANQSRADQSNAIPQWTNTAGLEESIIYEEESPVSSDETFECVLCDKIFKSEQQYNAHERSKKHARALRQVQKEMQQDDADLALHHSSPSDHEPDAEHGITSNYSNDGKQDQAYSEDAPVSGSGQPSRFDSSPDNEFIRIEDADAHGSEASCNDQFSPAARSSTHESRVYAGGFDPSISQLDSSVESLGQQLTSESVVEEKQPKIGKAKERRARKAAQANTSRGVEDHAHSCTSCQVEFSSKTKLFAHIKQFPKHAQPVAMPTPKKKRGKK
ncbi:uncharacterized protein KY384_005897 [Bacidia gigantensis]|uniref:uncharacterized protein n=1 Tax=Bacidia gigantensis TaxID=2732470 RepID=UPI001D0449AF|nr:uncharacterized protein KY384_005897 [Bacidia gigantensis]KAG8529262.1 hypothetical protein KY384_005897 [Bacidia gigantensis]